jgi:glycosyltransferase involved in cell wall biosynthesis
MRLVINATCLTAQYMTGIERFAQHICRELYDIDNDVRIISSQLIAGVPFSRAAWLLSSAKRLLGSREYFLRALWDQTIFRRLVVKERADVAFFPIQDGMICPPVRQIVTVHDLHYLHFDQSILECSNEISPLRKKVYQYRNPHVLERSAAIVAVSESTKKDIIAAFGINPDKIHVIHNGYDEKRFRIIDEVQPILSRYGLRRGGYFLFVGSILKHKNIVRLVQAFATLGEDCCLIVAGANKDDDYLNEILSSAHKLGLSENRFRSLEFVPDADLPSLYNGAAAFVLPSLHEGFGVPIIEAMACGTPVITSNCSAMPEVAGDAALLVDPYSVESIASAMREILDNPQKAETLRTAGLERAKMFRWSYSAQKLYDVCKMVNES